MIFRLSDLWFLLQVAIVTAVGGLALAAVIDGPKILAHWALMAEILPFVLILPGLTVLGKALIRGINARDRRH